MIAHGSWKCNMNLCMFLWVCPFCFVSGFRFKKSKRARNLERPWEEWHAYWNGTLWSWTYNHEGFGRACRTGKYNKKHEDGTTWLLEVQHVSTLSLNCSCTCVCECPFSFVFYSKNSQLVTEPWETLRGVTNLLKLLTRRVCLHPRILECQRLSRWFFLELSFLGLGGLSGDA